MAATTGLDWPLPVDPPAITGTFLEPRSSHFHSGLDLRTAGRTRLPVRTPVAVEIVRLRSSARGYGKAVYAEDGDGRTWVYAHLEAFADPLAEVLRQAWARTGRYEQDLRPERGRLRLAAGEVLGLSGDTGTGAPHLHLEVRDASGRCLDPLEFLALPDDRPPEIGAVRLLAADPASRVGEGVAAVLEAGVDTVSARGEFHVQASVLDRTPQSPFPVGPAEVHLFVDGRLHFSHAMRSLDFDRTDRMPLVYERREGRRWIHLFRREGDDLEGRSGVGDGRVRAREGVRVEVEVVDRAGNRARRGFVIVSGGTTGAESSWATHSHLRFDADSNGGAPSGLRLEWSDSAGASHRELWPGESLLPAAEGRWTGLLAIARVGPGRLRAVDVGSGRVAMDRVLLPGGAVTSALEIAPGVRAETLAGWSFAGGVVWAEPVVDRRARGPAFALRAEGVAFRRGLEIELEVDPSTADLVLVEVVPGGTLVPADDPGRRDAPDRLRARIRSTGTYLVVVDDAPPRIGPPTLGGRVVESPVTLRARPDRRPGVTRPRWPALGLSLGDERAGLDPEGVEVLVNGARHAARHEPEDDRLWLEWEVDPGPGEHLVEIGATDRLGHRARRTFTVRLVE